MPYWCTDCRKYFSVKVETPMQSSKLPLRKWVLAMYMMGTSLKGVSSMKIYRSRQDRSVVAGNPPVVHTLNTQPPRRTRYGRLAAGLTM